jgi:hypothetical protein
MNDESDLEQSETERYNIEDDANNENSGRRDPWNQDASNGGYKQRQQGRLAV